jgi:hypothetical protein
VDCGESHIAAKMYLNRHRFASNERWQIRPFEHAFEFLRERLRCFEAFHRRIGEEKTGGRLF